MDRRRRERFAVRLPFDVYCRTRRLGRFWTQNVSREGLFLGTGPNELTTDAILDLRFRVDGVDYCLRGTVVHQGQKQGIGIQLAYWRNGDRPAYLAYLQYAFPEHLHRAA